MDNHFTSFREPREYLLVPAKPAANGGLHLGHVAGPYLRMDLLCRHLLRRGDRPRVIFGTDVYDSFVKLMAEREGVGIEEIGRECHRRIFEDLRSLAIRVDDFIDPLHPEWHEEFVRVHRDLVTDLVASGRASEVPERLLYCPEVDRFVTGAWLLGRCSDCGAEVAGYFCEDCGAHFQPEELEDPRPRDDWGPVEEREVRNLFLPVVDPRGLLDQLRSTGAAEEFRRIVACNLRRRASIRLTCQESWGIPWSEGDGRPAHYLFAHGLLFAYCLVCGERYRHLTGAATNPFLAGSEVVTVNLFGLDNVASHMLGIQGVALADERFRPFQRFVVNDFFTLEGSKFSTSRRHAIWCRELLRTSAVPACALRYFLASRDPTTGRTDLTVEDLIDFVNTEYVGILGGRLDEEWGRLHRRAPQSSPPESLVAALGELLETQDRSLRFRRFRPREAAATLSRWLRWRPDPPSPYWWGKGFALLTYPVMPELARSLWSALGAPGEPTSLEFPRVTPPSGPPPRLPERPVTRADLAGCLPPALR